MEYNLKQAKKDLKPMTVLFKSQQAVLQLAKEDAKNYGLTINEFAVLEVLFHKNEITIQDICNITLIPNSSMSYVLDKLVNNGYLKKTQDKEDKRIFKVSLAEKGYKYALLIMPKHYERMKEVFNVLNKKEQEQLVESLKKIGFKASGEK